MNPNGCLESLGLTPIEALAYTYLVTNPAATGYRVACGVGKPTANVYRALESLERKGAVTRDRSAAPLFRALPPDVLLEKLEQEFQERRTSAAAALATMPAPAADIPPDSLATTERVIAKARSLLSGSRREVLVDATAETIDLLSRDLDAARGRRVEVLVTARGSRANTESDTRIDDARARDDYRRLRMVVDGHETLLADLSPDGERVRDAVWSQSTVLAAVLRDAFTSEWLYLEVGRGVAEGLSVDEVERSYERCRALRGGTEA